MISKGWKHYKFKSLAKKSIALWHYQLQKLIIVITSLGLFIISPDNLLWNIHNPKRFTSVQFILKVMYFFLFKKERETSFTICHLFLRSWILSNAISGYQSLWFSNQSHHACSKMLEWGALVNLLIPYPGVRGMDTPRNTE